MLDSRAGPGDAGVAALLAGRQGLIPLSFALDVYPPALLLEAGLAFAIDVALVAVQVAAGVGGVQHVLQMERIVRAGGADLELGDQLIASVRADRNLVAEVRFPVLLGPGGVEVLLPAPGRRPVRRSRLLLDQFPFLSGDVLPVNGDEAGVHDLPATGEIAVAGQLAVHGLEQCVPCLGHRQPSRKVQKVVRSGT